MLSLLLVCLWSSVTTIQADIDYNVCNPINATLVPPPLPGLAKSYTTRVEWKTTTDNTTIDVYDVHNSLRNMGSLDIRQEGQRAQIIYDYQESQMVMYLKDSGCTVQGLGSYEFYQSKIWFSSLNMIFGLMRRSNVEYMGSNYTIRSTTAGKWRACLYVYQYNMTVQIDMYYSVSGWKMALSPPNQFIPLRLEITGSTSYKDGQVGTFPFHVIGDISDFDPFPDIDETQLQVPPGTFCTGRDSRKPIIPLPKSMSVVLEKIDMDNRQITYESIWYDADKRLIRRDYKEARGTDPDPVIQVFDFNIGAHYSIDPYMGNCQPISNINLGDLFVADNGNNTIRMQSVNEIFHIQTPFIQYVGTRTARGVTCDVWVGIYLDEEAGRNFTVEWYFTKQTWVEAIGETIQPASLFRMDIWQGGSDKPIVRNILQLNSVAPTQDVFDVSSCFLPPHRIRMSIHYTVINKADIALVSSSYLKETLHMHLARTTFLQPLRITQASVTIINNEVYFDSILLDNTLVNNKKIVPPPPQQHPVVIAYHFLFGVVSGGSRLNVSSTVGKIPVTLESRSVLWLNYSQEFVTTTIPTAPSTKEKTPPPPEHSPTMTIPKTPTEDTPPLPPLPTSTVTPTKPVVTPPTIKQNTPCDCPKQTCPTAIPTPPKLVTCYCPKQTCPPATSTYATPPQKSCPPQIPCRQKNCPTQKPCPITMCPSATPPPTPPPTPSPSIPTCKPVTKIVTRIPNPTTPSTAPSTSTTNSKTQHLKQTGNGDDNSGMSGGVVAAIAMVMLILGLLMGMMFVLIYRRFRLNRPSDSRNILDKYLDNENNY